MASVASPSSPNSIGLRFGHWGIKPSSVFFKIRFRPPVRRMTLVSANGGDGQSWTGSSRSQDSFAGWPESDGGDGSDPKKSGGPLGGMLGAGLAGVFFAAGIAFASLSLSSRPASGVKQQMEPLTTEQKLGLISHNHIAKVDAKVDPVGNEACVVLPDEQSKTDECNSGSETGINKDLLSHMQITEDSSGSDLDSNQHLDTSLDEDTKPKGNDVDVYHSSFGEGDLHIGAEVDGIAIPSTPCDSSTSTEFISHDDDIDSSLATSRNKDSHDEVFSGSMDMALEHDPTLSTSKYPDRHQDEFEGQLQSKPPLSSLVTLESGAVVDSSGGTNESVDTADAVLKNDIDLNDVLQLPVEGNNTNMSVHDTLKTASSGTAPGSFDFDHNESHMIPREFNNSTEGIILRNDGSPEPHTAEVLAHHPGGNEPDINIHSQISRSPISESSLPEKPISYAGIPAPSLVSAALQVPPGKVVVPAVVDQVQGQALAALQVLKVIESDAHPGDLCTRREYARWLVSASSVLSRSTISKVYPAMYIENVTDLAFDDITPEDPDYSYIQGLAEAGIISSKLSVSDMNDSSSEHQDPFFFSPESPVSRQNLVSWKMALEKRKLPEVDKNYLYQCSGYIDIDKIDKDAWPALVADLSAGEQGITALAFGYTRLFQPNKPVTKAQAAIALATGDYAEVVGEELTRIEAESLAETAVNAHTALVAQVENELNASFEAELTKEREKINSLEKLAEEARLELERLKAEREEQSNTLIRGRAAVESEMEVLSRLRHEVEGQLQDLMSSKVEISFERDRINKLRKEAECENQVIAQLQYELEVERKALAMARAWAEEEAKRAREQARSLEEARDRWERHGIKVVVDGDLQEDALAGVTWLTAGQQPAVDETVNRAENMVDKLKAMAAELKIKSSAAIEKIIQMILSLISALKGMACKGSKRAIDLQHSIVSKAKMSIDEFKENASEFNSDISAKTKRVVEDCKESVGKFTQKFKT